MPVVLIDANIEGQGTHIWRRMQTSEWREFAAALDVNFQTFREAGLDIASRDNVVWRFCQRHGYYLLTGNRNEDSEDSLEATLRREGTATSLPVFTLPSPDRVYFDPTYLDRIVEKLGDDQRQGNHLVGRQGDPFGALYVTPGVLDTRGF